MSSSRVFALSAVLVLAAGTGCSSSSGEGDDGPGQPALEWAACADQALQGAECATVEVPLDYANPGGETIEIALSRVAASSRAARIGSLLVNPGGPGGAGRPLATGLRELMVNRGASYAEVLARFDLIGFDPRGVLESSAVDCGDHHALHAADYTPDDAAEREALERRMREFAAVCERRTGALLAFVDTDSAARDMDQIRSALGEKQISYLGFSYGTVLGSAYAELFPERVRAFVLDGAVAPNVDGVALLQEQAQSLERQFEAFAADCDARPECVAQFGEDMDMRAAFDRAVEQADATPLVDPTSGEQITEGQLVTVLAYLLFGLPGTGPLVEHVIAAGGTGDGAVAAATFHNLYASNFTEAIIAISCVDWGLPDAPAAYEQFVPELLAAAPRFGQSFLREMLPCAHWPIETRQTASRDAQGAPPILVVGTTGDPSTPYAWAEQLTQQLESGVLLTREGVGHTGYEQSRCIGDAVNAYLLDLNVPAEGTSCPTP